MSHPQLHSHAVTSQLKIHFYLKMYRNKEEKKAYVMFHGLKKHIVETKFMEGVCIYVCLYGFGIDAEVVIFLPHLLSHISIC